MAIADDDDDEGQSRGGGEEDVITYSKSNKILEKTLCFSKDEGSSGAVELGRQGKKKEQALSYLHPYFEPCCKI